MLAGVAQEAEQLICNQPVKGSTPFASPGFRISSQVLVPRFSSNPSPEARRAGAFGGASRGPSRRCPGRCPGSVLAGCCPEGVGSVRLTGSGPAPVRRNRRSPGRVRIPLLPTARARRRFLPASGAAANGVVAKRPNAAGCKPAGFTPSEVRILPAPPPAPSPVPGDFRPPRTSPSPHPFRSPPDRPPPDPADRSPDLTLQPPAAVPPMFALRFPAPGRGGCLPLFRRPAGVAQLAERQPSKLRVAGSNPVSRSTGADPLGIRFRFRPRGSVAEHFLGKEGVIGSIPIVGSTPVSRPGPGVPSDPGATAAGNP